MSPQFIDTLSALETFLSGLNLLSTGRPGLYIDLEGNDLCRQGTLSLLTVLVMPRKTIHIIDVTTLGRAAFSTGSTQTMKSILESKDIIKVFFDIRNDSDALYSHHGIHVAGIQDIQLMELAARRGNKRCVNGLARCIESDSHMGYAEKRDWKDNKDRGRRLFAPEKGGSYAVFDQRPLTHEIIEYCAQDVRHMPDLRTVYRQQLCDAWWIKVKEETQARIRLSQSMSYNGKGRHMALGPIHWLNWSPTAAERASQDLLEQEEAATSAETTASLAAQPNVVQTAEPSTSGPSSGQPSSIAEALQQMILKEQTDDFEDENRDEYEDHDISSGSGRAYSNSDGGSVRDLTACDKECGYCGQCPY